MFLLCQLDLLSIQKKIKKKIGHSQIFFHLKSSHAIVISFVKTFLLLFIFFHKNNYLSINIVIMSTQSMQLMKHFFMSFSLNILWVSTDTLYLPTTISRLVSHIINYLIIINSMFAFPFIITYDNIFMSNAQKIQKLHIASSKCESINFKYVSKHVINKNLM